MRWSAPQKITVRNQNLDFSSLGNGIRFRNEWVLCSQTYPRPHYTASWLPRYGSQEARLLLMRSQDLENWSPPELLHVKGPTEADIGHMPDPYQLANKDEPSKYQCSYKQNGVSRSYSRDLKTWTFAGAAEAGENVCVLTQNNEHLLFNSPLNGIGIKRASYV